jgi:exodeoxyribonuclease-5
MFDLDELEEDLATTRSVEGVLEAVSEDPPGALTTGQADAWESVTGQLSAGDMAALLGPAGTGKSFLITRLAERLSEEGLKVLVVAPTHQAAGQLEEIYDGDSLTVNTVQSALGLVLKRDGQGDYELVPDGEPDVGEHDLVICDEASMVGSEVWSYVVASTRGSDLKWLFVGDQFQLPPVNEAPSPALQQPGAELTEIVRQAAGNPIIEIATQIREGGTFYPMPDPKTNGEEGIYEIRSYKATEKAARGVEKNPRGTRVLCWRNQTVRKWCRRIKNTLYSGEDRFTEGMHLLAQSSWAPEDTIKFHTSDLLEVQEARETDEKIGTSGPTVPVWSLDVKNHTASTRHSGVLVPRDGAQKTIDSYTDKMAQRQEWSELYEVKESFAEVRYGAATTVHRAQGTTLDTVLVDTDDLAANWDDAERNALQYVAATRPARHLILIR